MKKKTSGLSYLVNSERVNMFWLSPQHTQYWKILPILTLFIFCFSSKVVFAEQIENKPQCNDIAELKNAAKSLYDSKKKAEIDATELTEKYIKTGCDINGIVSDLNKYGYEPYGNGFYSNKDKLSDADKKMILSGKSFFARTWLKPKDISEWINSFVCSQRFELEVIHEHNQVKTVNAIIRSYCI